MSCVDRSEFENLDSLSIAVISLFPEMFHAITDFGITARAVKQGRLKLTCVNPRDFATDAHRSVDDRPYGGGPGMLMKIDTLSAAMHRARATLPANTPVIYLSPQGQKLDQDIICRLAQCSSLLLIAGRYEGIDQRFIDQEVDYQYSIGDYVLSGGELPAMVLIDAIARWRPEVLGDHRSAQEDSFATGLLDHPHYSRPALFADQSVPDVLLSGHHAEIRRWRLKHALGLTWRQRPDLIARKVLTEEEQTLLHEYVAEYVTQTGYGGA